MKKLIYLLSITVVLTVFTSVSANAQTLTSSSNTTSVAPGVMCDFLSDLLNALFGNSGSTTTNNGNITTNSGSTCNTGSTQLPINGGVEFLMAAGVIIGIVTVQRYKAVKTAVVVQK